jgi:hypothetical protein
LTARYRHHADDLIVCLLYDIRAIFDELGVDRVTADDLVARLIVEDAGWSHWRGPRENDTPSPMRRNQLVGWLRDKFGIEAHTIQIGHGRKDRELVKGFYYTDFKEAWASYCDDEAPPPRPKSLRIVGGTESDTPPDTPSATP